jgi:hypothetical protein
MKEDFAWNEPSMAMASCCARGREVQLSLPAQRASNNQTLAETQAMSLATQAAILPQNNAKEAQHGAHVSQHQDG